MAKRVARGICWEAFLTRPETYCARSRASICGQDQTAESREAFRGPPLYLALGPDTFVVNVRAGPCWIPWNFTMMVYSTP